MKKIINLLLFINPIVAQNLNEQLLIAVDNNNLTETRAALALGANLSGNDDIGSRLLTIAFENNNPQIIRSLIEYGAKPSCDNLILAITGNHEDLLHLFLPITTQINSHDDTGLTPLMCAAQTGSSAIIKTLLDAGADVNAEDTNKITPLLYAASRLLPGVRNDSTKDAIQLLLDAGANVNAQDNYGETALMLTAQGHTGKETTDVAQSLLEAHADPNIKYYKLHLTACDIAQISGHKEIFKLLDPLTTENYWKRRLFTYWRIILAMPLAYLILYLLEH